MCFYVLSFWYSVCHCVCHSACLGLSESVCDSWSDWLSQPVYVGVCASLSPWVCPCVCVSVTCIYSNQCQSQSQCQFVSCFWSGMRTTVTYLWQDVARIRWVFFNIFDLASWVGFLKVLLDSEVSRLIVKNRIWIVKSYQKRTFFVVLTSIVI